jgi:hypothetical protein
MVRLCPVRRLTALLPILALLAFAAPAGASKASEWKRVMRDHQVRSASDRIVVRPRHIGRSTVSVLIVARRSQTEPVLFPDALYGATAWQYRRGRWRRIDSAVVRPAVVRELEPGERVRVRLPLERRPRRIRVLVPVPSDRQGDWVDVTR